MMSPRAQLALARPLRLQRLQRQQPKLRQEGAGMPVAAAAEEGGEDSKGDI